MPRRVFCALNEEREQKGQQLLANPRNAAAGSLRQLDPKICADRKLDIFIFNLQSGDVFGDGSTPTSHTNTLDTIKELGFTVLKDRARVSSYEEIIAHIEKLGAMRDDLPYDIDGVVIKIDNLADRVKIGEGTKVSHLAYVGDAELGRGCNIGCGAIFVNYNGKTKSRTVVGDNSFIGSNCNVIAPVNIAKNSYICAGTTVSEDVAEGDFVIGRVRQQTKSGGAYKYLKEIY